MNTPPKYFYVFQVTEAEVDEETMLGPTYRLVGNKQDNEGRWFAGDASHAIRLAAAEREDTIYAAFPADVAVIERWPLTIDEMAAGRETEIP